MNVHPIAHQYKNYFGPFISDFRKRRAQLNIIFSSEKSGLTNFQNLLKARWSPPGPPGPAFSDCRLKIPKNSHFYRYELTLILKPLVIRFCPLKIFSDSFSSFYTVNNQNLKKSEKNYKGQKRFTKGFFWK